jgi:hypothetical protein
MWQVRDDEAREAESERRGSGETLMVWKVLPGH